MKPPTRTISPRIWWGAAAALALVGLALVDPSSFRWFPRCVFHEVTGWHCPGCGTSRALHALGQGEFGTAMRLNPLLFVLLPFGIYAAVRPAWLTGLRAGWIWTLLGVIVVFGVARNVPAFAMLAP